jgi:hypothetical protein
MPSRWVADVWANAQQAIKRRVKARHRVFIRQTIADRPARTALGVLPDLAFIQNILGRIRTIGLGSMGCSEGPRSRSPRMTTSPTQIRGNWGGNFGSALRLLALLRSLACSQRCSPQSPSSYFRGSSQALRPSSEPPRERMGSVGALVHWSRAKSCTWRSVFRCSSMWEF